MLEKAQLPSVITTMRNAQIRWAGHIFRMSDSRIPKQLLYGELSQGVRKVGGQRKRFKDSLKAYLKDFNIDITTWENSASDRPAWRGMIHKGTLHSEVQLSNAAKEKPVFKNYRRVSHLTYLSKLVEGVLAKQPLHCLHRNNLFPFLKSAYCRDHCTETALRKVVNDILLNMNNQRVTLLLLYVRIMFDAVTLSQLLEHSFGVSGKNLLLGPIVESPIKLILG